MSEKDWGLIRRFHIDNGELDGTSPQECFVLGYELAMIDARLEHNMPMDGPVHAANKERIEEQLAEYERDYTLTYMSDDVSEEWMHLRTM